VRVSLNIVKVIRGDYMKIILDRRPKMKHKPYGLILDPDKYIPTKPPATWRIKPRKRKSSIVHFNLFGLKNFFINTR
jgi:hypothetical protein